MLVIAESPASSHADQGDGGRNTTPGALLAGADLFVDQREEARQDQAQNHYHQQHRLNDEHDVPRIPAPREWPERTNTVVVGVVQKYVAESGQVRVAKPKYPKR